MVGANSVAVVFAICASPDPYAASRDLAGIIDPAPASQPHRIKYRQLTRI
jgi:thiamine monophosphate synthase